MEIMFYELIKIVYHSYMRFVKKINLLNSAIALRNKETMEIFTN